MRILINMLIVVVLSCINALAATEGLVAHYDFTEGKGSVVADASGNGNNGTMTGGVEWVTGEYGTALKFNGTDGYVDCGAGKSLDISRTGSVIFWFKPETTCQGGLVGWATGRGDSNQRFVVSLNTLRENRSRGDREYKELGLYISDGRNSDRPFASNFHEPYFPPADKWLFYAVTFDGRQLDIYQDGILVYTRFQTLVPDVKDVPLWLGRCVGVGGPGDYFKGLMDEVRIYNRPLSEQKVYQVYMQTAQGRDKDISGFGSIGIKPMVLPKPGTIFADLDYRGLVPTPKRLDIRVKLLDDDGKSVAAGKVHMLPAWGRAEVVFDVRNMPAGQYTISAGADKGKPGKTAVNWPGRAKGWENVNVLNNFCWELLNESPGKDPKKEYVFNNPRRGWLYVVAEAEGDVTLSLAGAKPPVLYAPGKGASQEAMRWMDQDDYTISVSGNGVLKKLIVRSTPALIFCHYPCVGPGTGNDHDFLVKYVLPHVNTMITGDYDETHNTGNFRSKWVNEIGRQCIEELHTTPYCQIKLTDKNVKELTYNHLAEAAGMNKTDFAGVILNEFDPGNDVMAWVKSYYDEWMESCEKIFVDPKYAGRFIIPWYAYNMFDFKKSTAFLQIIIKSGSYHADEIYVDERDTECRAWTYINEAMADLHDEWERAVPGATERMIVTLSYLQREYWNPAVDFKVYMDMQFEHLATRPEFFGLAGVMEYQSHQSTEEYVRWAAKLCRHYGLEGQVTRLRKYPYNVTHVRNGDFTNGTDGWQIQPAGNDSMAVKSRKGYGLLQDRYPHRPWTDTTFLWTRRSKDKPNVFSQKIKNLEQGRLYVVRLWIGDYKELITGASKDDERSVMIRVENGDLWNDWYKTKLFRDSVYTFQGYQMKPFGSQNQYYFKIPQLVFRAQGPTATLFISDWKNEKEPGGPIGQELMFNFIEVHPYLE